MVVHMGNGPNPSGLCMCGCGERTSISSCTSKDRTRVKGEPLRYRPNHHTRKSPHQYLIDPVSGCWVWQRAKMPAGYGVMKGCLAHRAFYEWYKGPIPDGFQIDHLCGNTSCVNPAHLEAVSQVENIRRSGSAKRDIHFARDVRAKYASGMSQIQISRETGVDSGLISRIVNNRQWREDES